jgi:4-aminobutyrate aminotransferase / (S)-3-amino-2-methylpropionate transaminase / 5-aminovalerate transaminase
MPQSLLEKEGLYCSQGDISSRHEPKKIFASAQGEWLIDMRGHRYLDLQMCNSAANFGHGSPVHVDALVSQVQTLPTLASEFIHEERVRLAEELCLACERNFGVKGRVHFSVGGAQAIDDMLKLINRLSGTTRIFAFEGSYHGRTLAASCISGSYRYRAGFGGVALADFVPFPYCKRCPYARDPATCDYECIKQFRRLFEGEGSGQNEGNGRPECRAFVAEPVLGRGGYVPAPPEYFQRLKEVLDEYGIIFVADEVQMGFFRAGRLWSIENYRVVPDIIVFGKAVTNGMFPLSGLWAREPLMSPENWPVGSSHATFAAAPLGTALGLATLRLCTSHDWATRADEIGGTLEIICRRLAEDYPKIRHVNRIGAAVSLDIADEAGRPAPHLARAIVETALIGDIDIGNELMGLVMTVGGGHGNMIMLAPSLTMESSSLALTDTLLRAVLDRAGVA